MRSLIVGEGYLAATLAKQLRQSGVSVEQVPYPDRPELDSVLAAQCVDQIVIGPSGRTKDEIVHRVDGPRWLVCSSAGDPLDAPTNEAVIARGGTVLRLATVFGRGGDDNVSRVARFVRRYRTLIGIGDGARLIQPLHIDDVVALVHLHLHRPASGRFEIAGPEAVRVAELCRSIVEIIGVRPISHLLPPLGRLLDARRSLSRAVIDWQDAGAPFDTHGARTQFGWNPLALGIRVEDAVHEALA